MDAISSSLLIVGCFLGVLLFFSYFICFFLTEFQGAKKRQYRYLLAVLLLTTFFFGLRLLSRFYDWL
ncbi:MAG: hypothetical protein FJZ56_05640 [Chlamydiae bacterium]|nr:hypothetical protein [Chlamydiota bacterium]